MAKDDLLTWCEGRPVWQQAAISMLTAAAELSDEQIDGFVATLKQQFKISTALAPSLPSLTKAQLKNDAATAPVTVLGSIGPLQNIDRLAANQPPLQFAVNGITLIYGANGSGKSGYCRIAKKVCRCLHDVSLRGNVYHPVEAGPRKIDLSFRVEGQAKKAVTWSDDTDPPSELRRISVFDSDAANLYVDSERKIEYLPFEISLMTNFATFLKKLESRFIAELDQLKTLVKTPLPTGYMLGTKVAEIVARVVPGGNLPEESELRALAVWNDELETEFQALLTQLKSDPALLLKLTKGLIAKTTKLIADLSSIEAAIGENSVLHLLNERENARRSHSAAKALAEGLLDGSGISKLGSESWRQMLMHAREFATETFTSAPPPAIANADVCVLCHQPLQDDAKQRLLRFDEYIAGKVHEDAEGARRRFLSAAGVFEHFECDSSDRLAEYLTSFIEGSSARKTLADRAEAFLRTAVARSEAVTRALKNEDDTEFDVLPELESTLIADLSAELEDLNATADSYITTDVQKAAVAETTLRLSNLEARKKLSNDVETVVARLRNLVLISKTKECADACATGPITTYITRMRRAQLTPTLRENFLKEVKAFDLEHLPLDLSDRGQAGTSKVQIGLNTKQAIKRNSDILSEGEKRALALAGFLAEVQEIGSKHGIIIDDPVSSLDHSRIEAVAKRLVQEARTGRQVIIFTHNLFFHYAVCAAARGVPLRQEWISKHADGRFGIIDEGQKPWVSLTCKQRLSIISQLLIANKKTYTETDETNRYFVTQIYTRLRETWEHSIEDILFAGVINRFRPDVQTLKLRSAKIEESDHQAIFEGMTRCSKYSGHDQPPGAPPDLPKFDEIEADCAALGAFIGDVSVRQAALEKVRKLSEKPVEAELL